MVFKSEKLTQNVPETQVEESQTRAAMVNDDSQVKVANETVEQSVTLINETVRNQIVDEGWSVVSPGKGCRSGEKTLNPLTFGKVKILSSSRYSVLNVEEETVDNETGSDMIKETEITGTRCRG